MKTTPNSKCCSIEDIQTAKEIAKDIGIEHEVIDLEKEFREKVIDYFVSKSVKGRNPNPCAPCNERIKFGILMRKALNEFECNYYATGHYARVEKGNGRYLLKRGVDEKKDQSYIFSLLDQGTLSKLILPNGHYRKDKVRRIARENDLKVYDKKENQDLCFLHEEKGDFIEKKGNINPKKGEIRTKEGQIIGKHKGTHHYTVGQRKGLGLKDEKRWYVIDIKPGENVLVVGRREDLYKEEFMVEDTNWIAFEKLTSEEKVGVVIRDKMNPVQGVLESKGDKVKVEMKEPIFGPSKGQVAAFYQGDEVVGGGWIA